jgi:hypothetical protein
MLSIALRIFTPIVFAAFAGSAYGMTVTIHSESAKAVLQVIQNPALSHAEALKTARMYGNQGVIRKLNEFKIPATTESLANALHAVAHGQKVTDPSEAGFDLDTVKSKASQLLVLIQQIETNPQTFQAVIERRIALFTPLHADLHLDGYIVAAGDGGGYAFGATDFYLNVGIIDELVVAQGVTAHELYHAVQGAFAKNRAAAEITPTNPQSYRQVACAAIENLFAKLYEEGSAMEVEDVSLLSQAHSAIGIKKHTAVEEGMAHLQTSVSLLEMSVLSLNADSPMLFDDVYAVGFYGQGTLYNIGYVMAEAIVENDGPQGLATFLMQPPYKFVLHYTHLAQYGADSNHPRLGPNTVAAANRQTSGCH